MKERDREMDTGESERLVFLFPLCVRTGMSSQLTA